MEATVEISLYPLRKDYEEIIIEFIKELRKVEGLEIRPNPTATHLYGPYDLVMDTLKVEMAKSFEKYGKAVFAVKVLLGDRRDSIKGLNL